MTAILVSDDDEDIRELVLFKLEAPRPAGSAAPGWQRRPQAAGAADRR